MSDDITGTRAHLQARARERASQAARGAAAIDSQVADASIETQVAEALAALRVERP